MKTARNTMIAFERGREDYDTRNFVNPYKGRSSRAAWARGLRAAAQEHREAVRKVCRRADADLYVEGTSA